MSKSKGRIVRLAESKNSVLGLDCSSSVIGFGLIDLDTFSLSAYGHIRPLDNKFELLERLNDTFDRIEELCKTLKPKIVAVEDIFVFMKGMSTAKTITILTAFNRTCGLAAYRNSQKVVLYSVGEIRKTIKNHYKLNKI